jgi:peroxiredoxin
MRSNFHHFKEKYVSFQQFNEAAGKLGDDVVILTVSMDLPFAQKRWCGAAGVESVITLSDHRDAAFGTAFGVLIKELRLLGRSIFVLDRSGEAGLFNTFRTSKSCRKNRIMIR